MVTCLSGALPRLDVAGGNDIDGNTTYIRRVKIDNDFLPVNVTPDKSKTLVWCTNKKIEINDYEALDGLHYEWVEAPKNGVPITAVQWDTTLNGESLYVGCGYYKCALYIGKVQSSQSCLFVQYVSKEIKITNYEILVDKWVNATINSMPKDAIECGCAADGDLSFVDSVFQNGSSMLAKVIPNKGGAFVNCNSKQHKEEKFQVLTGANVYTADGDILFIGRAYYAGSLSIGKVYSAHGCIYLPIGDEEVEMKTYEVLKKTQTMVNLSK
ncbi:uncharacterized protein LOC119667249 [Teleopsis dalmanni]|uniref:uncharacterized protein LOC119667249 n=1 Tax=Teleopsis dalmanni TaxID=139649 RepID=UPI0018CE38D0|nr:uncharacterized protein LOC119667249 [Teleopsis dalmanni]